MEEIKSYLGTLKSLDEALRQELLTTTGAPSPAGVREQMLVDARTHLSILMNTIQELEDTREQGGPNDK